MSVKVNDMDKYQVTEAIEKAREIMRDPEREFHIHPSNYDEMLEIIKEIENPYRDKDGFVHKHYLREETKGIIEYFISRESKASQ